MASEATETGKAPKDRSPSFPFIGLPTAIERLVAYDAKFGRHPTPANKIGLAWAMKEASSQAAQTVAALKSFGMVDYQGSGPGRLTNLTEEGRNYLRAQQDSVKRDLVRRFALKPKVIAKYWSEWGHPRPIDEVCLDELVLKAAFTQSAAETFLRVYDATMAYAGLAQSDTGSAVSTPKNDEAETPAIEIEVGDLVAIEVAGQLATESVKVRAIRELDGRSWVFVDGSETGIPRSDATLVEKGSAHLSLPKLPLQRKEESEDADDKPGSDQDRFTVDEGVVKITFPSNMSPDSIDELEQFLQLFIKKAKRRATMKDA